MKALIFFKDNNIIGWFFKYHYHYLFLKKYFKYKKKLRAKRICVRDSKNDPNVSSLQGQACKPSLKKMLGAVGCERPSLCTLF